MFRLFFMALLIQPDTAVKGFETNTMRLISHILTSSKLLPHGQRHSNTPKLKFNLQPFITGLCFGPDPHIICSPHPSAHRHTHTARVIRGAERRLNQTGLGQRIRPILNLTQTHTCSRRPQRPIILLASRVLCV